MEDRGWAGRSGRRGDCSRYVKYERRIKKKERKDERKGEDEE